MTIINKNTEITLTVTIPTALALHTAQGFPSPNAK